MIDVERICAAQRVLEKNIEEEQREEKREEMDREMSGKVMVERKGFSFTFRKEVSSVIESTRKITEIAGENRREREREYSEKTEEQEKKRHINIREVIEGGGITEYFVIDILDERKEDKLESKVEQKKAEEVMSETVN